MYKKHLSLIMFVPFWFHQFFIYEQVYEFFQNIGFKGAFTRYFKVLWNSKYSTFFFYLHVFFKLPWVLMHKGTIILFTWQILNVLSILKFQNILWIYLEISKYIAKSIHVKCFSIVSWAWRTIITGQDTIHEMSVQ